MTVDMHLHYEFKITDYLLGRRHMSDEDLFNLISLNILNNLKAVTVYNWIKSNYKTVKESQHMYTGSHVGYYFKYKYTTVSGLVLTVDQLERLMYHGEIPENTTSLRDDFEVTISNQPTQPPNDIEFSA